MPRPSAPFDFGNTLKQQANQDRALRLDELALNQSQQRIDLERDRHVRLTEDQKNQIASAFPQAIGEAMDQARNAPSGQRVPTFLGIISPILNRGAELGVIQQGTIERFSGLTEEDFFSEEAEQFSASVKQGLNTQGQPVFFQAGDQGGVRQLEGVTPLPRSGEIIETTPNGGVRITRGGAATNFGAKAQGRIEDELISLSDTLLQTRNLKSSFKPEFHQLSTRFSAAVTAGKSFLGQDIDPEERTKFEGFADYKANAANMQSQVIKALSGAAVNAAEEKRLQNFLVNPGTGIFDGDDPISAERKMIQFERLNEMAHARLSYLRRQGIPANDEAFQRFPLEDMPGLMRRRGQEILAQLTRENPDKSAQELREQAKTQLGQEFGLL